MKFYDFLLEKALEDGIEKTVVGGIVVDKENNILILTRKQDDFMGGIDELPSGKMEPNENIYEALVREIKEESNLDIDKVVSYISSFDYLSGSGKKTRQFNFAVKVKNTKDVVLTEHDSYMWQGISECRNNSKITSEVKQVIEIFNFNEVVCK